LTPKEIDAEKWSWKEVDVDFEDGARKKLMVTLRS
jgi:hypothetical protein